MWSGLSLLRHLPQHLSSIGQLEESQIQAAFGANTALFIAARVPQVSMCEGVSMGAPQVWTRVPQRNGWSSQACWLVKNPTLSPKHTPPPPLNLPQILSNFWSGSTGHLSLATSSINTIGCIVRIFTTLSENAGAAMLRYDLV